MGEKSILRGQNTHKNLERKRISADQFKLNTKNIQKYTIINAKNTYRRGQLAVEIQKGNAKRLISQIFNNSK